MQPSFLGKKKPSTPLEDNKNFNSSNFHDPHQAY